MKIFPKILLIGIVGILVAASVGTISIWSGLKRREYRADEYLYRDFRSTLRDAQIAHMNWLKTMTDAMIEKKPEFTLGINGYLCDFGKWYYLPETKSTVDSMSPDIRDAYEGIAFEHLEVHRLGGEMIELWKKGEIDQCYTLFNEKINPTIKSLLGKLIVLEDFCAREVEAAHARGEWLVKLQDIPTYASLIIGILILAPFCYFTARSIVRPLVRSEDVLMSIVDEGQLNVEISEKTLARKDEIGELVHSIKHVLNDYKSIVALAEKLADGDWQVEVKKKSEHDDLNDSLGDMLDHVNGVLLEISACTDKLDKASDDVSEAAASLTSGSQESAASLEQITASMNEISGQTKKNAQSADEAHDLALQASQAAVKGHAVMQEMVNAMQRITDNSTEIQRVIRVIDDIAFQTNLLALNAAVEAARAGQHGKGFAVVAEEVRNLASRSAKAAEETSELITKSGQEIVKGNEEATRTSEVLNTIVEQIKKTTDLVSGIAVASKEQAEGVNQISIGLTQIDTVTQQNTAATEEASSAAQEMASMATNLKELVSRFKLRR